MPLDDRVKESFAFARDTTKQLLTLSTAILTLTVTFQADIVENQHATTIDLLTAAWIAYLVSIIFGLGTLMTLTGTLAATGDNASINSRQIRIPAILQAITFLIATALVAWFGARAV
ncbi:MAG: hypothetical protein ACRDJH_17225 [Thermomicrobiales bacterium]